MARKWGIQVACSFPLHDRAAVWGAQRELQCFELLTSLAELASGVADGKFDQDARSVVETISQIKRDAKSLFGPVEQDIRDVGTDRGSTRQRSGAATDHHKKSNPTISLAETPLIFVHIALG